MPATAAAARNDKLDAVIRGEFDEMPGMRLTLRQVCRLWALTPSVADAIIQSLVDRQVLTRDDKGRICRPGDLMR